MFDKAGHMVDALVDMTAGVSETIDLGKSSLFVLFFCCCCFLMRISMSIFKWHMVRTVRNKKNREVLEDFSRYDLLPKSGITI